MPNDSTVTANTNLPALWFLNGQIVRANQWGCNCRGVGAQGGCGELDIAEVNLFATYFYFFLSLFNHKTIQVVI